MIKETEDRRGGGGLDRQLTSEELHGLKRHERLLVYSFVGMWIVIGAAIFAMEAFELPEAAGIAFVAFICVAVAVGGWLQFSMRCPRCGANLGLQTRLLLPDNCRKCHVALKPAGGTR